ncbi:hypothetical protein D7V97_20235 [Corallococcus sp. CA053C]|uniref:P-loop NTPase fold protein n=1 Tax=Corallococcus sp. CA053C TaxID=2316732 RepID=UPI000EA3ABC6|nr:P-loop NTPase fold protein [Corallococcus sp. CA053C]RKH08164.1 hypothetical protein D7V97_20235 [Corallococcus sp. CA053C]
MPQPVSNPPPQGLPATGRWMRTRGFRWPFLVAAVVLALLATLGAFLQPLWPDSENTPTGWDAWLYPRESNSWMRVAHGVGDVSGKYPAINDMVPAGGRVYLALDNGKVAWSGDQGLHWHPTRLPEAVVPVALAFRDEQRGYAATRAGRIFWTEDGGAKWVEIPSTQPAPDVQVLAAANDDSLWMASSNKVWRRAHDGQWQSILFTSALFSSLLSPSRLVVSGDASRAWVTSYRDSVELRFEEGRLSVQTGALRGTPSRGVFNPKRAWSVTIRNAYRLEEGTQTPIFKVSGDESLVDIQFLADGRRGWILGAKGLLRKTDDGGLHWSEPWAVGASEPVQFWMSEAGDTGWIRDADHSLWYSQDGGLTWSCRLARSRAISSSLLVKQGAELWAGTSTGALLHSTNGGTEWESTRLDGAIRWLGASADERSLFALTSRGLWRAVDDKGWRKLRDGDFYVAFVAPDQRTINLLPSGLQAAEVSRDDGTNWTRVQFATWGIRNRYIAGLASQSGSVSAAGDVEFFSRGVEVPQTPILVWSSQGPLMPEEWQDLAQRTVDAPFNRSRLSISSQFPEDSAAIAYFVSASGQTWALGSKGQLFSKTNSGVTWTPHATGTTATLNSIRVAPSGQRAWLFGDENVVRTSQDGGRNWEGVDNRVSPARWYWLCWAGVALLVWGGLASPHSASQTDPVDAVANLLVTDSPIEHPGQDRLGIQALVLGLSNFIRNTRTQPPLTIAVTGEWGTGKSSVLNLLRTNLVGLGFRPVSFNAWHHQQEDNLLAALYASIISQSVPNFPSLDGLDFRWRLFVQRSGSKLFYLFPLLALLVCTGSFFLFHEGRIQEATAWMEALPTRLHEALPSAKIDGAAAEAAESSSLDVLAWSALVTTLTSLLLLARQSVASLRAFGVDPARLVASLKGSVQMKDHRERVSFQSRFAKDFQDVTQALGMKPLVILIDDLDRCTPENAMKVLEAINFLVSSGHCFVVMAISRRVIEEYVAMHLKDIADAMLPPGLPRPEAHGVPPSSEESQRREARLAHARHYLEKLINIEMPVPALTDAQAEQLTQDRTGDEGVAELGVWHERRRLSMLALALLLMGMAAVAGARVPDLFPQRPHLVMAPVSTPLGASQLPKPAVPEKPPKTTPEPESPNAFARMYELPEQKTPSQWVIQEAQPGAMRPWMALALGGAVILLWLWRMRQQYSLVVVEDSKVFTLAMDVWRPVIRLGHPTPRSVKRFLNRVRFLAMCRRAVEGSTVQGPISPPPERGPLIPAFIRWLRRLPAPSSGGAPSTQPARGHEHVLVTLAALRDVVGSDAIQNEGLYRALSRQDSRYQGILIPPIAHQCWGRYAKEFGDQPLPEAERQAFAKLSGALKT